MSARLIGLVLTKRPGMLVKHAWPPCVLCWDHMVLLTTHLDAYDKIAYDKIAFDKITYDVRIL